MPRHGESYRLLAGLRQDEMRWEEAVGLARHAVALLPSDVEAHQTLATALGGPDASHDWRGRTSADGRAEEAMHHFRRGLQLEAGQAAEPASLVVLPALNETERPASIDGTLVQFYGELGGKKGTLPEVDAELARQERWEPPPPPPPPPPPRGVQHEASAQQLQGDLIVLGGTALGGVLGVLVCWVVRCCLLAAERQRQPRRAVR